MLRLREAETPHWHMGTPPVSFVMLLLKTMCTGFLHCPLLQPHSDTFLANMPQSVVRHIPDPVSEPTRFVNVITGTDWIQDTPTQVFIIDFLHNLHRRRNYMLTDSLS